MNDENYERLCLRWMRMMIKSGENKRLMFFCCCWWWMMKKNEWRWKLLNEDDKLKVMENGRLMKKEDEWWRKIDYESRKRIKFWRWLECKERKKDIDAFHIIYLPKITWFKSKMFFRKKQLVDLWQENSHGIDQRVSHCGLALSGAWVPGLNRPQPCEL